MHHDLNYEKFLVARPLWAKFESGKYGIPIMWNTELSMEDASYTNIIGYRNVSNKNRPNGYIVENFAYDYELETIWRNPWSRISLLRSAFAVLTPDFSVSPEMNEAQIINSTFKNRWLGCFWQQNYIDAIATLSWAEPWTYDICLIGIPYKSPIAVSTIGVKDKSMFLDGYKYCYEAIKPEYVICFGKPIEGMFGNLIVFDYEESFMPQKVEQMKLFVPSRLTKFEKEEE